MGILVPPSSPATPLSYNPLPMNDLEGATSYDALCCGVGEAPSPNSTPDPSESSYVVYDFGYAWPQSDIRSVPHSFGAQSMKATCSRMTAGLVGGYTIHG
ncbi:hypothetical protein PHLCEN_2v12095 [Hermanssonia centrifuga]|uniref:Uncharacterized protein n=1 Tax=Hermanssonia centrifuga TaxID=98765 RepID=A0A2R6NI42_9APHY|nr:hypothetical protein PHLCEN_2v12095 [Hermanssonia centrifuga]